MVEVHATNLSMTTDWSPNWPASGPVPPPELFHAMGAWAALTGLVGGATNSLAIVLFIRSTKLRTPLNWLLMNLSLTELVIAATGNTVLTINSFHRRWTLSESACQANAFGMTFMGIQSIVTLAVLALQRFMMVSRDRQFPISTGLSTFLTVVFIWLYSFLVSFTPLLGWGTFGLGNIKVSCCVVWAGAESETSKAHMLYMLYIYSFGFFLPVGIILTSYLKIVKTIKNKTAINPWTHGVRQKSREVRDRKITLMVAAMVISFLFIWLPYACVSVLEITGYKAESPLSFYVLALPTMLTKTSVCVDPIIYFGLNPQFRAEMVAWLRPEQGSSNSRSDWRQSESGARFNRDPVNHLEIWL